MLKITNRNPWLKVIITSMLVCCFSVFASPIVIDISYIKLTQDKVTVFSNYLKAPENTGYVGAELAITDSNTTGKFLQQHFQLHYVEEKKIDKLLAQLQAQFKQGHRIFILDMPLNDLVQVNNWAKNKSVLLFNAKETANELRDNQCLMNIFHTIPSNAMKSDSIAQWLLYRRLNKVLLVRGSAPEDSQLVNSFKRSAKRYGLKIIKEKQWNFNTDLRRIAQQEIPLFTQTVNDYDVVYIADKDKNFAEYFPFNTYLPRPVVGSAGLEALSWHGVIEQWGAAQLQNRFVELAKRQMNEGDFAAYLAVRSVANAVHKLNSNVSEDISAYIQSDNFELAAYKGRKLSFRTWSKQLRIPMALVQPHALVSQSPQAGILHPVNELDTLGYDAQESQCK